MHRQNSRPIGTAVSQSRLWDLLMDVARYGATPKGGVNRQALSAEDAAARNHVIAWAAAHGYTSFQDEIGNLFVRREGTDPSLPPVMTGSHLDSQPTGGKFDGAYGVIAGLEVLAALDAAEFETRRAIEVVAWTNEEGSRFSPGTMGSSVFTGARDLDVALAARDPQGVQLVDALAATLVAAPTRFRRYEGGVHAYVEAHIEQGPALEDADLPIGVVTAIQGIRRLNVDVFGEEAHAGTTPRRRRKDALASAVAIIAQLQELTADAEDVLRFTIGRLECSPGSPNTVPSRVHFTIDLRHPEEATLSRISAAIHEVTAAAAGPCRAEVTEISAVAPVAFPSRVVDLVRTSAETLGLGHVDMPSGAGHDAMHLANICPSGMIFVPCRRGISHNEAESATPEHLAAGARVLAETLVALADS